MSPLTSAAIARLDPRYPMLWRDDDTVQFGLEGAVRVRADEPWVEPLLAQLRRGIRASTFDVVAHGVGAPRQAARELLAALHPVLRDDPPQPASAWVEGINVADDRVLPRITECLLDEGVPRGSRDDAQHVGVIVVEGAASALQLARYLRDDVPHLPVAFEPAAVTVGPIVVPGRTPCLSCRDAHERLRDPAWPRLHAQLVGRRAGPITTARVAQAASLAARLLRCPPTDAAAFVRVRPDGRISWRSVRFHEECRCRGLWSRSPQESARAPVPLDRRIAPMRAREFALPA